MERLVVGYALVLLLCVWIYPKESNEDDLSVKSTPVVNQGQIKTAEAEVTVLPKSKYPRMQEAYTLTQLIKKDERCTMTINESYESVEGKRVKIFAEVEFPAGSVDEDTEVTMVIDNKTGVASFLPKISFNKAAVFSLRIDGANQGNMNVDYYALSSTVPTIDARVIDTNFDEANLALNAAEL